MYKKIILLVVILTAITISILGIYYGIVQNVERMVERKEIFNTIYIHIDRNAQKVKKMLKDFPIYYINLDRVKDRRDFMEEQIKKYGVKMTRISAVDALDLDWKSGMANDIPYENYYKKNTALKSYKMAELACTLSHLYTIKQSYDNGDEIALILEDDVDIGLAALWEKSLKELIKSVPKGWESINLLPLQIDSKEYNIFIPFEFGKHWGCAAHVINRKGMEKVLKVYNNNKFILQGPKYLVADYFIYSLVVNIYTYTKKYLFLLSDFTSNIQEGNVTNYTVLGQTLVDDMEEYLSHINFSSFFNTHRRTTKGGLKVLQFVEVHPGNDSFSCDMKKIWGPDIEAEFIGSILFDYKLLSSTLNTLKPSGVLAINSNKYSVKDIEKAIEKVKPSVLLLLGDEKGDRSQYEVIFNKVDLVYRQYRYNSYKNPSNQRILPLGYHCWDTNAKQPSQSKKYIWSFIGSKKGKRAQYLSKLNIIKPNFYGPTKPTQNSDILNSSIFIFCPFGNTNVECSRQYTASMCGAIPFLLCTNKQWNDTYPYLDIEPPWLHTNSIKKMIEKIQYLLQHPQELSRIQLRIQHWWNSIQKIIYNNIDKVINHNMRNRN